MARFCKKCGSALSEGIKFCAKCGTPTGAPAGMWLCPSCGHENKSGKFCAKCGTAKAGRVSAPASSVSVAAVPAQSPSTLRVPASPVSSSNSPVEMKSVKSIPAPAMENSAGNIQNTVASSSGAWKKILPVCALVAVAAYFAFSMFMNRYEAKCEQSVAVMTESKGFFDALAELSGDKEADETKKTADGLAKNAEKLGTLIAELAEKTPPSDKAGQHEQIMEAIGKNKELLEKAAAIIGMEGYVYDQFTREQFEAKYAEFIAAWENAYAVSASVSMKEKTWQDVVPFADMKNEMEAYKQKKLAFDDAYSKKKQAEYAQKRQEKAKELMGMNEVVFLVENVRKDGKDLIVSGCFYNGTGDLVSGIRDMLADVKLLRFDEEVQTFTDAPCSANLSGIYLAPQNPTDLVEIRLQGKAPDDGFNNFEVNMHKIRWSIRRAVQR